MEFPSLYLSPNSLLSHSLRNDCAVARSDQTLCQSIMIARPPHSSPHCSQNPLAFSSLKCIYQTHPHPSSHSRTNQDETLNLLAQNLLPSRRHLKPPRTKTRSTFVSVATTGQMCVTARRSPSRLRVQSLVGPMPLASHGGMDTESYRSVATTPSIS
jgi:hypothetical protein